MNVNETWIILKRGDRQIQQNRVSQLHSDVSHIIKHVACKSKVSMSKTTLAYLTMCWETWCSFDLNTIKFNGLYKHRCEVVKLQWSLIFPTHGDVGHVWWGRPLLSQTWILLIARNMFDDVWNIRVELVYAVLLYSERISSNETLEQGRMLERLREMRRGSACTCSSPKLMWLMLVHLSPVRLKVKVIQT